MKAPTLTAVVVVLMLLTLGTNGSLPRTGVGSPSGGNPSGGSSVNQSTPVSTISVYTTYPGQNQYLALPLNVSGVIIYPHWVVTLISSANQSYSIYVSGLEITQGASIGVKSVDFNVVGDVVNVSIGFGGVSYHYNHEFLSNVPLSTYYSSPPAPPVATALQVTFDELAIAFAFVLSLAGAMFTARKTVVEKKKRQIQVVG